ncbi:hypothetical protein [Sinorhizobium fredii]|uniref:hypothetical protein n=1 Tax=Rhizobium fredii TaxID=380 RepID=UPI0004B1DEC3|nr:hypothetical protein [Sinorhizobium fredii]
MNANLFSTLRQRFPRDARVSDLGNVFDTVSSFLPVISGWKQEAARDKHLSAAGASAAYRRRIGENVMKTIRDMDALIADSKRNLEASRAKVSQPKYDPQDALAAAHRREIREFLRSVEQTQRLSLLIDSADPIFIQAALELPTVLSGIHETQAKLVRDSYAQRFNPDVLEHIEIRDEALTVMTSFAHALREEVAKHAGLEGNEFQDWYATGQEPQKAA